jgi:hypothetical protein
MPQPFSFIGKWNYTNPATPVAVNIPMTDQPDWVFIRDITASPGGFGGNGGTDYTANAQVSSEWFSGMAQGSFFQTGQAASALGGCCFVSHSGYNRRFYFY